MRYRHILVLTVMLAFASAVFAPRSYAGYDKAHNSYVIKAKVSGIDQLFVCTASVPNIFVEPAITYAAAKNAETDAPIKLVAASGLSPPASHY